jgi:hypothetical protein
VIASHPKTRAKNSQPPHVSGQAHHFSIAKNLTFQLESLKITTSKMTFYEFGEVTFAFLAFGLSFH